MIKTAELQKLNDALKKRIKEHEKAEKKLKDMQIHLVQTEKLVAIGELAAGIAHEINNPLSFISLNIDNLKEYAEGLSNIVPELEDLLQPEEYHSLIKKYPVLKMNSDFHPMIIETQEGIERIKNIVQSLKGFSRLEDTKKFRLNNINEGLKSTLVVAQNDIKYCADVQVSYGRIPRIECNLSEINQVFLNILVNAVAAIKEQNTERGVIAVRTYADENYVYCEIENEGKPIAQRYVNKIFDPFFTTKPVGKGTGLGLSISYDIIVHKHNGELRLDKTFKNGARFVIALPILTDEDIHE